MKLINIYCLRAAAALIALAASPAGAQTRVDQKTQTKSIDYSGAASTKSFQTGASLPATCSRGQTFFSTSAAPGANFYACTTTNTWSLETGSNAVQIQSRDVAAIFPSDGQALIWSASANSWQPGVAIGSTKVDVLTDCQVVRTSATVLTVNGTATSQTPCNVRVGTKVTSFNGSATITLPNVGSGGILIYFNYDSGAPVLEVAYNGIGAPTCSGMGCGPAVNSSTYPVDGKFIPLHEWLVTVQGTWDPAGTPRRAVFSTFAVNGASGIAATPAADGTQNIAVDATVTRTNQPFVVEGANAYMGVATLVAGTATVSTTAVAANSRIFLALQDCAANVGSTYVGSRTVGTSFVIQNTNASNVCNVAWLIMSPQ